MSQELINRSPDLKKLRDEGYDIEERDGYLLVKHVPYVNSQKEIKYGVLVSKLKLAGDQTDKTDDHVALFVGEHPCNWDGTKIIGIEHGSGKNPLLPDLMVDHSFSNKPLQGFYDNYHHKMTRYIGII